MENTTETREAYRQGYADMDAKHMEALEAIQTRSAEIAERHREERVAAILKGYAEGRWHGLRNMAEAMGYRLRVRVNPYDPGRYEWVLECPEPRMVIRVGDSKADEWSAMADAENVAPALIARREARLRANMRSRWVDEVRRLRDECTQCRLEKA